MLTLIVRTAVALTIAYLERWHTGTSVLTENERPRTSVEVAEQVAHFAAGSVVAVRRYITIHLGRGGDIHVLTTSGGERDRQNQQ